MQRKNVAVAALLSCGLFIGCALETPLEDDRNQLYSTYEFKAEHQELPPVDISQLVQSQVGSMAATITASAGETASASSPEGTAITPFAFSVLPPKSQVVHGLRKYVVHSNDLSPSAEFSLSPDETEDWYYLVVHGEQVFRVVSGYRDGAATILAFGSAAHAGDIYKALKRWPVAEGYGHRYITVASIPAEFLQITRSDTVVGLVPFMGARALLGMEGDFDPSTILKPQGIMGKLKEGWEKHKRGAGPR